MLKPNQNLSNNAINDSIHNFDKNKLRKVNSVPSILPLPKPAPQGLRNPSIKAINKSIQQFDKTKFNSHPALPVKSGFQTPNQLFSQAKPLKMDQNKFNNLFQQLSKTKSNNINPNKLPLNLQKPIQFTQNPLKKLMNANMSKMRPHPLNLTKKIVSNKSLPKFKKSNFMKFKKRK